jgi:hypothetical protein
MIRCLPLIFLEHRLDPHETEKIGRKHREYNVRMERRRSAVKPPTDLVTEVKIKIQLRLFDLFRPNDHVLHRQ